LWYTPFVSNEFDVTLDLMPSVKLFVLSSWLKLSYGFCYWSLFKYSACTISLLFWIFSLWFFSTDVLWVYWSASILW
jgi:hypothetical protein